jgi:hypothetical protein
MSSQCCPPTPNFSPNDQVPSSASHSHQPTFYHLTFRISPDYQPTVPEDNRGLPADRPDSLALCVCHCTPSSFQTGRATTQGVSRQTSPQRPGFKLRPVHVRFWVDEVALGQVFPKCSRFPCQCRSTKAPHSSPPTFYSYQKDRRAKPSKKRCPS